MSITTAARVKTILGLAAGVTFHDTAIGYAVDYANRLVLGKLGQTTLAVTTTTEYPRVYGPGQVEIQLAKLPVVGIGSITNSSSVLTASEYRLDDIGNIRLTGTGYWDELRDGCQVTYGHGYDSTTIPADLVRAAELIAVSSFNRAGKVGIKMQSSSGFQVQLDDQEIPAEARAVLSYYEDRHIR